MRTVDFAYLEGFLGGDKAVAAEVLNLFCDQAKTWGPGLDPANPDWRAVAHTVKGAARGIGANALGEACHAAEFGQADALPAARSALAQAVAEIGDYLAAGAS